MKIGITIDGVLRDWENKFKKQYNEVYQISQITEEVDPYDIEKYFDNRQYDNTYKILIKNFEIKLNKLLESAK